MLKSWKVYSAGLLLAVAAVSGSIANEQYPTRPVTIVVPFEPGGATDDLGRLVAAEWQKDLKQPFIVENRTGAGGTLGNAVVARSAPDGYTLLHAPTAFSIVPFIYKQLPYDTAKDFAPIGLIGLTNFALVANPSLHLKTVEDVVALAKKMNGKLTYASPGLGTSQHLFAEYFRQVAGINLIHVPYKGSAPALLDIMSGQVAIMISDLSPALPLIQSGKLTVIAVTSAKRNPSMPEIPTIAETYPGFLAVGWQGLLAPSGTPDDIIRKLNETLSSFVSRPETVAKLLNLGVDAKPSSPGEMGEWINAQLQQWQAVAKNAGISPE